MKTLLLSGLVWIAWGAAAASVRLQQNPVQQQGKPWLLEWWPVIVAVAGFLVAWGTMRANFTAHQRVVEAALLHKADKATVEVEIRAIRDLLQSLKEDMRSNAAEQRAAVAELRGDIGRAVVRNVRGDHNG